MKLLSGLVPVTLLIIAYSFCATAYADNKGMVISNHTSHTLYFTVNGQCTTDVIVVPFNKVKLSAYTVGLLCGKNSTCVFQARDQSCDGSIAGTLTISPDNTIEAVPGFCFRVDSRSGYRNIKFDVYMSMSPMC